MDGEGAGVWVGFLSEKQGEPCRGGLCFSSTLSLVKRCRLKDGQATWSPQCPASAPGVSFANPPGSIPLCPAE